MKAERDTTRCYEEMLCHINEIITTLREDNRTLKERNSTVISIDEHEGSIAVYTSNMC